MIGAAVKNTLWLMVFAVPLQVLFAFGIAHAGRARKTGSGSSGRSSTCPRSRRRSPPRSASCTSSTRPTGPVNMILGPSRHRGPALVPVARVVQALAGAARHLGRRQPDDHLPRRRPRRAASTSTSRPSSTAPAPLQRLRYVTLPTISPVILFSVVIGVIDGDAVLHAGLRRRQHRRRARRRRPGTSRSTSATRRARRSSIRCCSTSTASAYFNMGYASAMAVLLLVVAFAVTCHHPRATRAAGCTTEERSDEQRRPSPESQAALARRSVRLDRPPPPAPAVGRRTTAWLIAVAIMFLLPFVFIVLTSLMTSEAGALARPLAEPVPLAQLRRRLPRRRRCWRWTAEHDDLLRPRDARRCWSRASRSPTRSRGCAGAAATSPS